MLKNRMLIVLSSFFILALVMYLVIVLITKPDANDMRSIIIAGDENFPPFEFIDDEGDYRGFNIDIMKAIGLEMGLDISLKPMPWAEAIEALMRGDVDAIQGMARSVEREEVFSFVSHSIENALVIFTRKDTVYINSIDDLDGVKVAFQEGDIATELLQDHPEIIPIFFTDQEAALKRLAGAELGAFIGNRMVALYFAQKYNLLDEIKIVGEPFQSYEYGAVTLRGNTEVFDLLNEGMHRIKKSGLHSKIHKTWFGETFGHVEALRRRYITIALISIALLIIVTGFAVLINKRLIELVKRRTSKLTETNQKLLEQQKETYKLAYYNTTTGLPNRAMLMKRLSEKILEAKKEDNQFGILCLDIDKIKSINNTMGRSVGDKLLKAISEKIRMMSIENAFIANFSEDSFVVIYDKVKKGGDCERFASVLMEVLGDPFFINSYEIYITVSMGLSFCTYTGRNPQDLIRDAEIAKFKARSLGGNQYCIYNESMKKDVWRDLRIVEGLRKALANDEFRLYYQPKVDLNTVEIIGMEALLRWYHPELGKIPPDEFIPIAEETGLIVPIGEWVMRTACLQTKEWHNAGFKSLHIAVNISPRQFQGYDIERAIKNILEETNLEAKFLVLEITETIVVESIDSANDILKPLKNLGVAISIDDFGSGYSNFSRLNEMSIDEIKIDKSIVQATADSTDTMVIVDVILMMAKKLNMTVTAEGVETAEQREYLKEKECNNMQGYLFSPPLTTEKFGEMLKNNAAASK